MTIAVAHPMRKNASTGNWTDERTNFLKARWAAGDTCSQIARELGGMTRNAIIGKVHRLKLPTRIKAERKPEAPRIHRTNPKPKPAAHHPWQPTRVPAPEPDPLVINIAAEAFDSAIPRRQRKTIFQLENKHCRYPVGEPGTSGFFYCGGPADNAAGQVYCSRHMAVCFTGVPKKPRHEFRGPG